MGLRNLESFSWLNRPSIDKFKFACEALRAHGLITHENYVTPLGQKVLNHPLGLDGALLFEKACRIGEDVLGAHIASLLEETKQSHFSKDPLMESDLLSLLHEPASFERKKVVTQLLGTWKLTENLQLEQITRILLGSRFDQVCQRRDLMSRKAKHFSGKGAELHLNSACLKTDYFVAFHAQSQDSEIIVRSAHGVTKNSLLSYAKQSIQARSKIEIDWEKRKVLRIKQRWLGTFLLDEARAPYETQGPLDQQIVDGLAQRVFEIASSCPESWLNFLERRRWINQHGSSFHLECDFFDQPSADLALKFAEALCEGCSSFEEIFEKKWLETYFLIHPEGNKIRSVLALFPDSISLKNGQVKKILYHASSPHLEGRVQDFFGLQEHPCLLQGRIKLKLVLLGPHQRPIQITSDLPSFWKSSYPSLKKELKGQYPKHFWPDNPETERPPVPRFRK
jgi:ATP-dependent helicase HrpB